VSQQNRQNPAGQIGAPPVKPGIDFQYQVLAQGRLIDAGEFATNFQVGTPALTLRFDREKARTLGIPDTDVYDALQTYLGGFYVNLFNRFGRTWQGAGKLRVCLAIQLRR
jgi:multidrug efflux pump subunit AcrB